MELGENLRARRRALGLTLDTLAARSGVSRAMLSEIERGLKNPTVRVAAQIAEGLEWTISALVGEAPAAPRPTGEVVRVGERRRLVDPESGVERHLLSTLFLRRGVEVLWYVVPPGGSTGLFPPHRPGVEEHLTVVSGRLDCTIGREHWSLNAGDSVAYPADAPHGFVNPTSEPCQYFLIIDSRPQSPPPPRHG